MLERYDSSYELRRFEVLDSSPLVKTWTKKHKLKLGYKSFGSWHKYIPDILIQLTDGSKILEEIKGHIFDKRQFMKKNRAALAYCTLRGWKFRTVFLDDLERV